MKAEIEIKIFDDQGKLLSKTTQELIGLQNQMEPGASSGLEAEQYKKVNQALEKFLLEAQAKSAFF